MEHLHPRSMFLLLLCALSGAIFANAEFRPVRSENQLWRFKVGKDWESGFSVGDEYICLLGSHGRFVRVVNGGVHNDKGWCKRDERFEIEFIEGNRVRLKSFYERMYIACWDDGNMHFEKYRSEKSVFEMLINNYGDKVAFFSHYHKRYLSAHGSGKVTCDQDHNLADEQFEGWKRGPRSAWKARDEWQTIGAYDNRFSSGWGTFVYTKIVGVERTKERSVLTGAGIPQGVVSLIGLRSFFSGSCDSIVKYEWSKTSSETWNDITTITASIQIPPGKRISLHQAVGFYGIFTIYSNYFQARDFTNETEIFTQGQISSLEEPSIQRIT